VFQRRHLQARVFSLTGLGVLLPLAMLAIAGEVWVPDVTRETLADRQETARLIALRLDHVLQAVFETLQQAASARGMDLEDGLGAPGRAAVHEAFLRLRTSETVFLADATGTVVYHEPQGSPAPSLAGVGALQEALHAGRPGLSTVVGDGAAARVYALVPVRGWRGDVRALLGAVLDPRTALGPVLGRPDGDALLTLVDAGGSVVAANDPVRAREHGAHVELVALALQGHHPVADTCAACGPAAAREERAAAPLATAPWAVRICRPEGAASTLARLYPRALARTGAAALAIALLFAWGAARSVRRPLEALTESAEGIAAGRLDRPIPLLADDEVGRLGRALERMRLALRKSIARVADANLRLEHRVEQRTAELEQANRELQAAGGRQQALYRELQKREEARLALLRKVIGAQEDERRRIARELHDETSQSLASVAMRLEGAVRALPEGEARRAVADVQQLAVRTLDEVHRLVLDLRPSVLDDLGLLSAIRWCAERHLEPAGIACRCELQEPDRRLPAELETALFRVCQEAITNIARHAGAESVLIQVGERAGRLVVEIEDDGRGFVPSQAPGLDADRPSFGLMGMRERVELLGGTLDIDSAPEQGTRVKVEIPLPAPARAAGEA